MRRPLSFLILPLLLSACASKPSPFVGLFAPMKDCRAKYEAVDARVDAAGVRDAAYYRVPGFPYLRTDRLLASYASEVKTFDEISGWTRRMREMDQEAREFEYRNLGLDMQEAASWRYEFAQCSRALAGFEIEEPEDLERLKARVQPPDDYSTFARVVGLHALTESLQQSRLDAEHAALRAAFREPLTPASTARAWKVAMEKDHSAIPPDFDAPIPDELGFPGLTDTAWHGLAEIHAPTLWMETASDADRPGAPVWNGERIGVNTDQPEAYFQINFTRFGGRPLVQISYFFWFQRGQGLDGLIWRVTLDRTMRPLAYESLRASGREHLWFPAQPLQTRTGKDAPCLLLEGLAPKEPALHLAAGTQALRHVIPVSEVTGERSTYALKRYELLFTLPREGGGTRSMFDTAGYVRDSESPDPVWMWSSGLREPGVPRQYGHHAISYTRRHHFDDAFLLERVFVPPAAPPGTESAAAPAPAGG